EAGDPQPIGLRAALRGRLRPPYGESKIDQPPMSQWVAANPPLRWPLLSRSMSKVPEIVSSPSFCSSVIAPWEPLVSSDLNRSPSLHVLTHASLSWYGVKSHFWKVEMKWPDARSVS